MQIKRSDIVGARVVEVYTKFETQGGISIFESYFTVDRGFTFAMPYRGRVWRTTDIPPEAERQRDVAYTPVHMVIKKWFGEHWLFPLMPKRNDMVRRIKSRQIAGVFCSRDPGNDWDWEEGTLVFDDGSQLWNYTCVPEGIPVGLIFKEAGSEGCIPMSELMDYFSIRVREEEPE
jgi:hypothetical protein